MSPYEEYWLRMIRAAALGDKCALDAVYEDMRHADLYDDEVVDLMNMDMDIRERNGW